MADQEERLQRSIDGLFEEEEDDDMFEATDGSVGVTDEGVSVSVSMSSMDEIEEDEEFEGFEDAEETFDAGDIEILFEEDDEGEETETEGNTAGAGNGELQQAAAQEAREACKFVLSYEFGMGT